MVVAEDVRGQPLTSTILNQLWSLRGSPAGKHAAPSPRRSRVLLLFGLHGMLVELPAVAGRAATEVEVRFRALLSPLARTIAWLARQQLVYSDLRWPNVIVDWAEHPRLANFDDCMLAPMPETVLLWVDSRGRWAQGRARRVGGGGGGGAYLRRLGSASRLKREEVCLTRQKFPGSSNTPSLQNHWHPKHSQKIAGENALGLHFEVQHAHARSGNAATRCSTTAPTTSSTTAPERPLKGKSASGNHTCAS